MRKEGRDFYSKILLFGEYSIICNSMGLTIPYLEYKGKLRFSQPGEIYENSFAKVSNASLQQFFIYLNNLNQQSILKFKFNSKLFSDELKAGIFFDSNIPQGYGIGSSGALCAAIYDRYAYDRIKPSKSAGKNMLNRLKDIFSQMESFFHGRSSGLDVLNCYLGQALLIKNVTDISEIGLPAEELNTKSGIFLINTGVIGKTEPLVNYFLEQCQDKKFFESLQKELIPANDTCIKSFVKGEMFEFYASIKSLSKYLLHNFGPMIPAPFIEVWKKGLETSAYYLKLCGSGGGGYLLGFAQDLEYAKEELEKLQVKIIPVPAQTKQ